jgi:hypothetical protein
MNQAPASGPVVSYHGNVSSHPSAYVCVRDDVYVMGTRQRTFTADNLARR